MSEEKFIRLSDFIKGDYAEWYVVAIVSVPNLPQELLKTLTAHVETVLLDITSYRDDRVQYLQSARATLADSQGHVFLEGSVDLINAAMQGGGKYVRIRENEVATVPTYIEHLEARVAYLESIVGDCYDYADDIDF